MRRLLLLACSLGLCAAQARSQLPSPAEGSAAPALAAPETAPKPRPRPRRRRRKKAASAQKPAGGDVQIGHWEDTGAPPADDRLPAPSGTVESKTPPPAFLPEDRPAEPSAPAAAAVPAAAKERGAAPKGSQVPGIYPVYEAGGRWMLMDRPGRRSLLSRGAGLVVIGSRGAEIFTVARSTRTWSASCRGSRHVPTRGYLLTARSARNFLKVGTPIIAILMRDKRVDLGKASFRALSNEVDEAVYSKLDSALRQAIARELQSGEYAIKADDDEGRRIAKEPSPKELQYKIDFGARVPLLGAADPFLAVEGAQVSQTYRRCLRLFDGGRPLGGCAQMPHALMTETRQLRFVAYDPSSRGLPFVLAFTKDEPLWGHERWGFQLTGKGPRMFLHDALDPRCREAF